MTTQITMMDRDEYLAAQLAEHEEAENDNEIAKLIRELTEARQALTLSEQALAAIEESLAGKEPKTISS